MAFRLRSGKQYMSNIKSYYSNTYTYNSSVLILIVRLGKKLYMYVYKTAVEGFLKSCFP